VIDLYVPYVDAKGHVVGHNIETITLPYGYKTIKTNELNLSVKDLYTTITSGTNSTDATEIKEVDDEVTSSIANNT
jgi:hypothetical protein